MTRTGTNGTAEPVTTPVIPADDRTGDGYDWMDTLEGTVWSVLPAWDSDGCDAGSWPCIIYAVARTRDGNGGLFGYGTCVQGGIPSHWFRSQDAAPRRSPPRMFFQWPPASPTARTTCPPPQPNCRRRTGRPIPAGPPRNTSGVPGYRGPVNPGGTPASVDNIIETPYQRSDAFAALMAALAACLLARTLFSDSGSTMSATERNALSWP